MTAQTDADAELARRLVPLAGARNFRDFGGWAVAGGSVRRGMLYRANRLSRLTDNDRATLDRLDIAAVFDLRARHEREADPTCWTHNTLKTYTFRPGHKRRLVDMAMDYPPDAAGAGQLMHDFYAELPRTMAHVFGELLERIAGGAVPCVIHCSAGKDRTGMAAALVLAALGVAHADIVTDYTLTRLARADAGDQARAVTREGSRNAFYDRFGPEAVAVMMDAPPAFIEAAFAAIDADHGGADAYLDSIGCDADRRAALRRLLTESA